MKIFLMNKTFKNHKLWLVTEFIFWNNTGLLRKFLILEQLCKMMLMSVFGLMDVNFLISSRHRWTYNKLICDSTASSLLGKQTGAHTLLSHSSVFMRQEQRKQPCYKTTGATQTSWFNEEQISGPFLYSHWKQQRFTKYLH